MSKARRTVHAVVLSSVFFFAALFSSGVPAAGFSFAEKLLPRGSSEAASFGQAVAIRGDLAVVGAPGENRSQGAAYLFQRSTAGWQLKARLTVSDAANEDFFGTAVAIGDGIVVVGAPFDDNDRGKDAGTVYLFVEPGDGWRDMNDPIPLVAGDGAAGHGFGAAIALDGDALVVGAPGRAGGDFNGAVYLFEGASDTWSQRARLTAWDGQNGDLFGYALDKEGDTVAVGAYGWEEDRGALYLFHKPATGWADATENRKLVAFEGESGDRFGVAVALAGDWVAVGADLEGSNGEGAGAVYLYSGPDWSEFKMIPSDGHADQGFGFALDASGDTLIVGAVLDDQQGDKSGAVYVYRRESSGWQRQTKLLAEDGKRGDRFGGAVALHEGRLLAGAYGATVDGAVSAGAAQLFIADNAPPQAQDDSFTVAEGAVLSKPIAVLLANDSDSDGDSLQLSRLDGSSAKGGTVIRKGEEFVYTPPSGYTGADSFGYTVSDGNGGTAVATVHVTVESAAGDKQASGDAASGGGGGGGSLMPLALMFLAVAGLLFRGRSPLV